MVVGDALNRGGGRGDAVARVHQGVVHGGVAVMVGLAGHAHVASKATARQGADPGQAGVGAEQAHGVVLVKPGHQSRVVELAFVQELVGLVGAAVAQQQVAGGGGQDRFVGPGGDAFAVGFAQALDRQCEGGAAPFLVFGRVVAAAAGVGAGGGLLLVVAGDANGEAVVDEVQDVVAVAAAADGVAQENKLGAAGGGGVVQAGLQGGHVAVAAAHDGDAGGEVGHAGFYASVSVSVSAWARV